MRPALNGVDQARLAVLRALAERGYQFTTPAPTTMRRVRLRRGRVEARDLADIFGWNVPFREEVIDAQLLALMRQGAMLREADGALLATLCVASVRRRLFLHTATTAKTREAVFFGPDSYRFAQFIQIEARALSPDARIADVGCGAGVGGLIAWTDQPKARVVLADCNPAALRLANVNAAYAGCDVTLRQTDGLPEADGPFDLIVANPPYVSGAAEPLYSGGGGRRGEEISLHWTKQAVRALKPGGLFLLYTGSAMVRGADPLREALVSICADASCRLDYRELDPDVFPSLLIKPRYWGVERIAAVGATISRPQ